MLPFNQIFALFFVKGYFEGIMLGLTEADLELSDQQRRARRTIFARRLIEI